MYKSVRMYLRARLTGSIKSERGVVLIAMAILLAPTWLYAMTSTGFIENRGQLNESVNYYVSGQQMGVYFTPGAVVLDFSEPGANPSESQRGYAIWIRFEGANTNTPPEARGELGARYNYFRGNNPQGWQTDVPAYSEVIYHELWPGIDLVFRDDRGKLTYDILASPDADLNRVRFIYEGATQVTTAPDGSQVIEIPWGTLVDSGPHNKRGVGTFSWSYGIDGVEIDPATPGNYMQDSSDLLWSTFLGSTDGNDVGRDVALDGSGNPIVLGLTYSANFPTIAGAYDRSYNGASDIFVAKFNSSGSVLMWSTYLGGEDYEYPKAIVIDESGNPIVTGSLHVGSATSFPTTTGAYDQSYNGGSYDVFLSKLSANGSSLLWSTFFGGGGLDVSADLAFDSGDNLLITGITESSDLPTTPGAYEETFDGYSYDGFVTKFNASGSALVWSTYLGGSESDQGTSIAIDHLGAPVVVGITGSNDFPVTPGAYDETYNYHDVFVTKFNETGSSLTWSTFLGGGGVDGWGTSVSLAIDSQGNPVVTGITESTDFPTTYGALDESFNGQRDSFVTKLNSTGSALLWSTYLGGSDLDYVRNIALDPLDHPIVIGDTESTDFPTTHTAYDESHNGEKDVFVTILEKSGNALRCSSFLGGDRYDKAWGLAQDADGNVVVTGETTSSNFPTTPGAYDPTFNDVTDRSDVFLAKLRCDPLHDYTNHDVGNCILTMTDQGIIGYMDETQNEGSGFVYPATGSNQLYVGGLWVSKGENYVANRDYDSEPTKDWMLCGNPDGHVVVEFGGAVDQVIHAGFTNAGADSPHHLYVRQESWAFNSPTRDDFIIIRYFIHNRGISDLDSMYAGLFLDFDLDTATDDEGYVDRGRQMAYLTDGSGIHTGLRLLDGDQNPDRRANLTLIHNPTYVWPDTFIPDSDKIAFLQAADGAHIMTDGSNPDDYGVLLSAGPFSLAPGDSNEVAFAVVGGLSLAALQEHADTAQAVFLRSPSAVLEPGAGTTSMAQLLPSLPNPFNPTTAIRFRLAESARVELGIYDVGGRRVRTLATGPYPNGEHSITWHGCDERGRRVASGVYFSRLKIGPTLQSQRMILMR